MRLKDQHLKYEPEERIPLKNRDHCIFTAFLIIRYLNIANSIKRKHANVMIPILISVAVNHKEHKNKSCLSKQNLAVVLGKLGVSQYVRIP